MNKTVLFLINGLGIEKKDSYSVYDSKLMPNFDQLMNKEFFTSLMAPATNINDAYKYFSISTLTPLEQPFIKKVLDNEKLNENPKFDNLHKEVFNCNGNIHIFCFLNDDKVLDSLKQFIKALDPEELKKFYIHFVFTHENDKDFYTISKLLARYQYSLPKNVFKGIAVGKNILFDANKITDLNEYVRILYNGVGEIWRDVDSKLNALFGVHANPSDTKAFYLNDPFKISSDDLFITFNYENYDFSNLINTIKNPPVYLNVANPNTSINGYSLFPLKNTPDFNNLYDNIISDISMAKAMEQINGNTLVLIDKENVNMANFMLNGLTNNSTSRIKYVLTDNGILNYKEQLSSLINDPSYQLIVLNYSIDNINDLELLKNELAKIDNNIGMVYDICKDKIPLIVSSLYGMTKEIIISDDKKEKIDFSGKVPAIIIDSNYDRKKYTVGSGDTYSLFSTSLKFIKPELKVSSLLRKKSFLESIIKK